MFHTLITTEKKIQNFTFSTAIENIKAMEQPKDGKQQWKLGVKLFHESEGILIRFDVFSSDKNVAKLPYDLGEELATGKISGHHMPKVLQEADKRDLAFERSKVMINQVTNQGTLDTHYLMSIGYLLPTEPHAALNWLGCFINFLNYSDAKNVYFIGNSNDGSRSLNEFNPLDYMDTENVENTIHHLVIEAILNINDPNYSAAQKAIRSIYATYKIETNYTMKCSMNGVDDNTVILRGFNQFQIPLSESFSYYLIMDVRLSLLYPYDEVTDYEKNLASGLPKNLPWAKSEKKLLAQLALLVEDYRRRDRAAYLPFLFQKFTLYFNYFIDVPRNIEKFNNLFSTLYGTLAPDDGFYNQTYTEFALVKNAELKKEQQRLSLVNIEKNVAYIWYYDRESDNCNENYENEIITLFRHLELEIEEGDFHKKITFTIDATKKLEKEDIGMMSELELAQRVHTIEKRALLVDISERKEKLRQIDNVKASPSDGQFTSLTCESKHSKLPSTKTKDHVPLLVDRDESIKHSYSKQKTSCSYEPIEVAFIVGSLGLYAYLRNCVGLNTDLTTPANVAKIALAVLCPPIAMIAGMFSLFCPPNFCLPKSHSEVKKLDLATSKGLRNN